MPLYEYLCRDCNRVYEFFLPTMADPRVPGCPKCGNPNVERQISLFAFRRGGKNPLAAIPEPESEDGEAIVSEDASKPVRDDGLYIIRRGEIVRDE